MSANTDEMRRSIRWLQVYAVLMTVALVVSFARDGAGTDGVLRARGLIIEDQAGRERILLGAPIPEAANRVRTDTARLRELWGPQHPDIEAYMDSYREYEHGANNAEALACSAARTAITSLWASIRVVERPFP